MFKTLSMSTPLHTVRNATVNCPEAVFSCLTAATRANVSMYYFNECGKYREPTTSAKRGAVKGAQNAG